MKLKWRNNMKTTVTHIGYILRCKNTEHVNKQIITSRNVNVEREMQYNNPVCGCDIIDQEIAPLYEQTEVQE
jgi:hypothetical protein